MLSMIGLVGGLILLIILTLRGVNLFIAAPLCALLVALSSDMAIFPVTVDINFINAYMDGFASFLSAWFFMFLHLILVKFLTKIYFFEPHQFGTS